MKEMLVKLKLTIIEYYALIETTLNKLLLAVFLN
jgi:hypothetical protein